MAGVLIVDDEPAVLRVMAIMLRHGGYLVAAHDRPAEALQDFASQPHMYDALVTDVMMPGMFGTELAARALEIRPGLPVVFVTGFAPAPDLPRAALLKQYPVLGKPDQIPLLRVTLATALRRAEAAG